MDETYGNTFASAPALSAAALLDAEEFRQQGFVIVRGVFGREEIARLRAACDHLCTLATTFSEDRFVGPTYFNIFRACDPFARDLQEQPPVTGMLRRVTYPYAVDDTVEQLRRHPPLLRAAAALLGDDLVQIVNQVNFNPPQIGTGWGWHQDYRFRRHGISNLMQDFVQCLTAIDSSSAANGGFRLVARSHQLGALQLDLETGTAERAFDARRIVVPELQPGDTVFFNAYVIHGSTPNTSLQQRRVFINGFARAAASSHGNPVLRGGQVVCNRTAVMEFETDLAKVPLTAKY